MKTKNLNFKFLKKCPKIKIPSLTIEKFCNDYSKIFCQLLNLNANHINKEINDNYIISNKEKSKKPIKISKNENNIEFINNAKLYKLKSSLNTNKRITKNKSHANLKKKIIKKTALLEQASPIINNIEVKKSEDFHQSNSEKNLIQNNNSNNLFSSLNKKIKINLNINVCNEAYLLRKQKSYNNKRIRNDKKPNMKLNKRIKNIEIIKTQSVKIQNNKFSNKKEIIKRKKSKIPEKNRNIDTKIIYKNFIKNKKEDINKDKIYIKISDIDHNLKQKSQKSQLNNKTLSNSICFNNMENKKIKKYYMGNKKKLIIYNHTDVSPNNKKIPLLKKQLKTSKNFHINNNQNIMNSNIPSNNNYSRLLTKIPIKTESISIDLSSNNHKKIFHYFSDKKIKKYIILNNKNIATERDEQNKKYLYKIKNDVESLESQIEINHSFKTLMNTNKKSRSLSKRRDEKKKLNMIKLKGLKYDDYEEIKLKNIIKSLENQKNSFKLKKNKDAYSEPKKLIDRIRKIIKLKKF